MKAKVVVAALVLLVLLGVGAAALTGHLKRSTLRIGVVLPFTGPNASFGLGMRNSIRLAIEERNAQGGVQGQKLELVELDDASDPERAIADARQLVADPKMLAAIVNYDEDCSSESKVIYLNKLPTVLGGIVNRTPSESAGDGEFRFLPDTATLEAPAVNYAWNVLGARKFTYGSDETTFGKTLFRGFRGDLDGPMGSEQRTGGFRIQQNGKNVEDAIKTVADVQADYVIFGGQPRAAAMLLKALRASGYKGAYEAATHTLSQEYIDAAGPDAEGTLHTFLGLPLEDYPAGKTFLAAYNARHFAEPPSDFGIFAYAETQALLAAMDKSFLTRASIAGALKHEALPTILGEIHATYQSSTYQGIAIYQVKQGHWVPIYVDRDKKLVPVSAK